MGKGKGGIEGYEVKVKAGRIIIEVLAETSDELPLVTGLNKALHKLGFKSFIIRQPANVSHV